LNNKYNYYGSDSNTFKRSQDKVLTGDWSLVSESNANSGIESKSSESNINPQRGDELSVFVYPTSSNHRIEFFFFGEESDIIYENGDGYSIEFRINNNENLIKKYDSGSNTTIGQSDFNDWDLNKWHEMRITTYINSSNIKFNLYKVDLTDIWKEKPELVDSVSVSDSDYNSGEFAFHHDDSGSSNKLFWDGVWIRRRNVSNN